MEKFEIRNRFTLDVQLLPKSNGGDPAHANSLIRLRIKSDWQCYGYSKQRQPARSQSELCQFGWYHTGHRFELCRFELYRFEPC